MVYDACEQLLMMSNGFIYLAANILNGFDFTRRTRTMSVYRRYLNHYRQQQ